MDIRLMRRVDLVIYQRKEIKNIKSRQFYP